MPESSFNSPVPPKLHLADVHSQLYQTPSTTSASSSLRTISTSNRKRSRIDESGKPCPLYDSSIDDCDDDLQRSSWLGRRRDDATDMDYDNPSNRGQLPLAPPIEASLDSLTADQSTGNSRKRSRGAWVGGAAEQDMEAMDEKNGLPSSARLSWSQSSLELLLVRCVSRFPRWRWPWLSYARWLCTPTQRRIFTFPAAYVDGEACCCPRDTIYCF